MREQHTIPNKKNFCGGNFQDWLEVMLVPECNAACSWCIEHGGFRPQGRATCKQMIEAAVDSGKKNIILLGGEPTLYPHLQEIIKGLSDAGLNVWMSTNGSKLNKFFVEDSLVGLTGINISMHHYFPSFNEEITGLHIDMLGVMEAIQALEDQGTTVRMNCNLIKGQIDSSEEVVKYVEWAKEVMGANRVRFAELKGDDESFVNATEIMGSSFGLNNDPFTLGCQCDTEISGMPVNFRQMCGLQTTSRPEPVNPVQCSKKVLYYDGNTYPGWQRADDPDSPMATPTTEVDAGSFEDFTQKVLAFTDPTGKHKRVEVVHHNAPTNSGCMY